MNTMFSFPLYVSVLKCTYSLPQAATKKQTNTDPKNPQTLLQKREVSLILHASTRQARIRRAFLSLANPKSFRMPHHWLVFQTLPQSNARTKGLTALSGSDRASRLKCRRAADKEPDSGRGRKPAGASCRLLSSTRLCAGLGASWVHVSSPVQQVTPPALSVTARRRVRSAGNARPNCSLRTDRPGHRLHPNARACTRPGAGPDLGSQVDQKGTRQPEGNALSNRTRRPFRTASTLRPRKQETPGTQGSYLV